MRLPGVTGTKKTAPFWLLGGICWLVYSSAYFGRINLSITLRALETALQYSKTSLGILASGFFFTYGAGQLINGILGDRYNPRYFIAIGIAGAGLSNILFIQCGSLSGSLRGSLRGSLPLMFLCWAANGYFQSMLWGPLVRIVANHTPVKHLHKMMLFFSSSSVAGYLVSYNIIGRLPERFGWKSAFFIPGLTLLAIAALWVRFFKVPLPQPTPEEAQKSPAGMPAGKFFIKSGLWIPALICVLDGIFKEGLTLWGPAFLAETQKLSMDRVLLIMSLVPLLNLLCIALSGWIHRLCGHQAERTVLCFMIIEAVFAALLLLTFRGSLWLMLPGFCGIFTASLAANNILTAFIPLNFQKEGRVSTAAGFLDCAIYAGAAIAGPGAGALVEYTGWGGVINGWVITALAAVVLAAFAVRRFKQQPGNLNLAK
ncbi:MAG: MFS transporter [Treponema sp.]|jgi:OPA family glycerol-3-phosphate transporter-like MFS transporter|nr:MFS transporter [Treponema sp.]